MPTFFIHNILSTIGVEGSQKCALRWKVTNLTRFFLLQTFFFVREELQNNPFLHFTPPVTLHELASSYFSYYVCQVRQNEILITEPTKCIFLQQELSMMKLSACLA